MGDAEMDRKFLGSEMCFDELLKGIQAILKQL